MGFLDKLLGRDKKTEGEMMGDSSMQSEGMHQEPQGMPEDHAASGEKMPPPEGEHQAEHDS
jgi:uncharacterized protein YjbJ (UPF0337 family)